MSGRGLIGAALLLAVVAIVAIASFDGDEPNPPTELAPPAPAPASGDIRWLAPDGSDSNPGTKEDPWQTLEVASQRLEAGQTLMLEPGEYGARGRTIEFDLDGEDGAPITFKGIAGEDAPTILGAVRILGSHIYFEDLLFSGPTGQVKEPSEENPSGEQVQIAIDAGDEEIRDVRITGSEIRDSDWHAGVFITNAFDVQIDGNYIHGNGDASDSSQENQSHGIYWASGSGLVVNNLIENNLARGVQLFPEPSAVTVAFNTIVDNGKAGVQVAEQASNNLIINNIIANNEDLGVRSSDLSGEGNLAVSNLLWDNTGVVDLEDDNLEIREVLTEPPRFSDGFSLGPDSAGIDRADERFSIPFDIQGKPRPEGRGADLGAYESS